MDIRAHLERKGLWQPPAVPVAKTPSKLTLERMVPGEWHEAAGVRCFRAEQTYPLTHEHGKRRLDELAQIPAASWSPFLVSGGNSSLDIQHAVFLDTETSGLAQNSGTYVFMVGVGLFEGDEFRVRQYFMPDYGSEDGLLELLTQDLAERNGLITFNGRCFDWPLLEMRCTLNRRTPPLAPGPHLDLLPLARKLWRRRLVSCSLSSLESNLLGIHRSQIDVPGYLIPQLYRDYVEWNQVEPMAGVFYHNALDILSMVSLATTAGNTLAALDNTAADESVDYISLGSLFTRLGRPDEALRAMRLAAESADPSEQALAYKHWSLLLKRLGEWEQAAAIWESQLEGEDIFPFIELAKYYEHHLRDVTLAVKVVQQAILWLQTKRTPFSRMERQQLIAELSHRLERLQRRNHCQPAT